MTLKFTLLLNLASYRVHSIVNQICLYFLFTEENMKQNVYHKVKCKIRMCDAAPECRHCTRRSCLQLSAGPLSSLALQVFHRIFKFNILQETSEALEK